MAPALLSVTTRGVFVQLHNLSAKNRTVFFLDGKGKSSTFDMPVWPTQGLTQQVVAQTDAAAADGKPVAVGIGPRDRTYDILTAARDAANTGWSIHATSMSPRDDGVLREWGWSYKGHRVGMIDTLADANGNATWAAFLAFRSDGTFAPPEPIATQIELGDQPKPCSAKDRAATARYAAIFSAGNRPLYIGVRHAIVIHAPAVTNVPATTQLVLLTDGAIVHGPPQHPCLAAFVGKAAYSAGATAVIEGDLAHAWVFRVAVPRPDEKSRPGIDMRPMTCKYDASIPFPTDLVGVPGTVRTSP